MASSSFSMPRCLLLPGTFSRAKITSGRGGPSAELCSCLSAQILASLSNLARRRCGYRRAWSLASDRGWTYTEGSGFSCVNSAVKLGPTVGPLLNHLTGIKSRRLSDGTVVSLVHPLQDKMLCRIKHLADGSLSSELGALPQLCMLTYNVTVNSFAASAYLESSQILASQAEFGKGLRFSKQDTSVPQCVCVCVYIYARARATVQPDTALCSFSAIASSCELSRRRFWVLHGRGSEA